MFGWSAPSAPSKVPVDRNSTVRGKSRAIAGSAAGGVDRPRPQVGLGHAEAVPDLPQLVVGDHHVLRHRMLQIGDVALQPSQRFGSGPQMAVYALGSRR